MVLFDKRLVCTFLLAAALFILSGLAGYVLSSQLLKAAIMSQLADFLSPFKIMSPLQLLVFVFLNNSIKAFLSMASGLLLGLGPVLFLSLNGLVIGVVASEIVGQKGLLFVIAGILPHGIFEIPAILLASALGFRLAWELILAVSGKQSQLRKWLLKSGLIYIFVIVPVLIIAALVEVFITPIFVPQ